MKNKLGLLALVVALSAGPAWAGEEFCDDRGGSPGPGPGSGSESGTDPGGGSCEVNLIYEVTTGSARGNEDRGRIRDIGFNAALLNSLTNESNEVQIDWFIQKAELGTDTAQASEVRAVEWSFRPTDLHGVERTLVMSVRRKEGDVALMIDWLQAPRTEWSYASQSGLEPLWLDHRAIALGPTAAGRSLYLKWVAGAVVVGAWTETGLQETRFALPSATWKPVRLRSALLYGVPTQPGSELKIGWPLQFRQHWSRPVSPALPGQPEEPGPPGQPPQSLD